MVKPSKLYRKLGEMLVKAEAFNASYNGGSTWHIVGEGYSRNSTNWMGKTTACDLSLEELGEMVAAVKGHPMSKPLLVELLEEGKEGDDG